MKELSEIMSQQRYMREPCFDKNVALMLQPQAFSEFDQHAEFAAVHQLFTQNDAYRGLDVCRLWAFILNTKQVLGRCEGSMAELGVYKGQSAAVLSAIARSFDRKIYLCDTFEGFAVEQYESDMGDGKKQAFKDVSLESTKAVVGSYEGNRWVVGMFPQSVTAEMRNDTYAFVSIDCDIYDPIMSGLEFFWPRMSRGGMIFIHDYGSGHWPGATRAVDEFCAAKDISGVLLPDTSGSYILVSKGAR